MIAVELAAGPESQSGSLCWWSCSSECWWWLISGIELLFSVIGTLELTSLWHWEELLCKCWRWGTGLGSRKTVLGSDLTPEISTKVVKYYVT